MRELSFDITNLDRHLRRQILAIDFYNSRPAWVIAPNLNCFLQEMEFSTCLEMQTLVFLNRPKWKSEKIRSSNNVPLEINEYWLSGFKVILDRSWSHHNFFIIMSNPEWSLHTVISSCNGKRCSVRHNYINIFKLISSTDACSNLLVRMEVL